MSVVLRLKTRVVGCVGRRGGECGFSVRNVLWIQGWTCPADKQGKVVGYIPEEVKERKVINK